MLIASNYYIGPEELKRLQGKYAVIKTMDEKTREEFFQMQDFLQQLSDIRLNFSLKQIEIEKNLKKFKNNKSCYIMTSSYNQTITFQISQPKKNLDHNNCRCYNIPDPFHQLDDNQIIFNGLETHADQKTVNELLSIFISPEDWNALQLKLKSSAEGYNCFLGLDDKDDYVQISINSIQSYEQLITFYTLNPVILFFLLLYNYDLTILMSNNIMMFNFIHINVKFFAYIFKVKQYHCIDTTYQSLINRRIIQAYNQIQKDENKINDNAEIVVNIPNYIFSKQEWSAIQECTKNKTIMKKEVDTDINNKPQHNNLNSIERSNMAIYLTIIPLLIMSIILFQAFNKLQDHKPNRIKKNSKFKVKNIKFWEYN